MSVPRPVHPRDLEIVCQVEQAWADAARPDDDDLAGMKMCCGEYAYVATFFRGRSWRDVTLETLKEYEGPANACYAFMSGEAFRYYIPALILIALEEPLDGSRSEWEASMVDVAIWALNPPRYRPDVHALEQSLNSPVEVTSRESTARLRAWWDRRAEGFAPGQRAAILAFVTRMHERHGTTETAEALEHWSGARATPPAARP